MIDQRTRAGAQSDFRNYLFLLWRHLRLPAPTPVQYDIAHYLQTGPRRRMVKAFRGVGKSWVTAAFVTWRLWKNPAIEKILVVSASKERSDAFSTFTKRLIDEFELLESLRGRGRQGLRDSMVAFDVAGSHPAQAPSVKSVGITGQITGSRASLIVADDIESPQNSLTVTMRERLSEAVKEFDAVLQRTYDQRGNLVGEGDIVYLGTDQTEESLYKRLPERGYDVRIWPARVPGNPAKYGDLLAPFVVDLVEQGVPAGQPVDPKRFDETDLLEREASYGRSGFALQFMLDPSLSDEERYPLKQRDLIVMDVNSEVAPAKVVYGSGPDQLLPIDPVGFIGDRIFGPMHVSKEWHEYEGSVMFIDPSGRGADETSYAVVKALNGKLFLTAAGAYQGGYEMETLQGLAKTARAQKVNLVRVEPNYGGGMFTAMLKPVLQEVHPCTLEDADWARGQKELRIIDYLEPVMNGHRLVVDRGILEHDQKADRDKQLFYQMTRITRERGALKHEDRLEAVAGAVAYWVDRIAKDEQRAYESLKERMLRRELDKIMNARPIGELDRGAPTRLGRAMGSHRPRRM